MGQIIIKGLRLTAHHGVMLQERRVGNEFEINIRLDVPLADQAMSTDELSDTINYAEVVSIVKAEMAVPSKLIENVAGRIRKSLCERFGTLISGGEISVAKLAPPIPAQLASVAYVTSW